MPKHTEENIQPDQLALIQQMLAITEGPLPKQIVELYFRMRVAYDRIGAGTPFKPPVIAALIAVSGVELTPKKEPKKEPKKDPEKGKEK